MLDAVLISDLHLGSLICQRLLLRSFLMDLPRCRQLVILGDLLEGTDARLSLDDWLILELFRNQTQPPHGTRLVWVSGNHDWEAWSLADLIHASFCQENFVFESGGRKVFCSHGHQYDPLTHTWTHFKGLLEAPFASLQYVNLRLARRAKRWSKVIGRCCGRVMDGTLAAMKQNGCSIGIAGHTHYEATCHMGRIAYHNLGSWTNDRVGWLEVADGNAQWHWFN